MNDHTPSAPNPLKPSKGDQLYRWGKNNEVILYLFFGVLTTAINYGTFLLFEYVLKLDVLLSVALAWFISVLFAYITNKIWVFKKRSKNPKTILEEASLFFAVRGMTGLLDLGLMWLLVEQLDFSAAWMKLWVNVLIVILNYITSKLWVFKKVPAAQATGKKDKKKK